MLHNLFTPLVTLEKESHVYRDREGKEYLSVSKFLSMLSEKFEDTRAYKLASEETRLEWKAKGRAAADRRDAGPVHRLRRRIGGHPCVPAGD